MRMQTAKPLFIIGCPRSGTTWLYHLILSSGGFAIYRSESQIYSRFAPSFGRFRRLRQRLKFLDFWLSSEFFRRSGLDAGSFRRAVVENVRTPGDLLRFLMDGICSEQHAMRWAECTPDHALYITDIKRDFPDALFVHIVRDGRDVSLSLGRQSFIRPFPWDADCSEVAAAAYWSWITNRIKRQAEFLGDDLLTIKYEDLVEDLEKTLQNVAEFIDKPIDIRRINENAIGAVITPNSSFAENETGTERGRVPRWQSDCESGLLAVIEEVVDSDLEAFGYALASARQAPLKRYPVQLRRSMYFLRFRAGLLLKRWGVSRERGLLASGDLPTSAISAISADPTLRPRENLSTIRKLVGS